MNDLISRQDALQVASEECREFRGMYGRIEDRINQLPSAESEIIRCKDCKNFRRWIDTDITFCDLTDGIVCEKHFCSRAERRTDG